MSQMVAKIRWYDVMRKNCMILLYVPFRRTIEILSSVACHLHVLEANAFILEERKNVALLNYFFNGKPWVCVRFFFWSSPLDLCALAALTLGVGVVSRLSLFESVLTSRRNGGVQSAWHVVARKFIYFSFSTKDVRRLSEELMFSSPPTRSVIERHSRVLLLQEKFIYK